MHGLKVAFRSIASVFVSIGRIGRQRFTVMFIPHSEKRIFNFQISVFMLVFVLSLVGLVGFGFFFLSTRYSGTTRLLADRSESFQNVQSSLEMLREEIGELQKVARVFQGSLNDTLDILGIDVPQRGQMDTASGDLSSFLSLSEVGQGELRELHDVQNLTMFLRSTLGPLNEINGMLASQRDFLIDIPTLWPLKGVRGRITLGFGPAIHPFTGQWYLHRGIDIAFGFGVPIVATANGRVVEVNYEPLGFGHYIVIRHKYGFSTKYAHLQTVRVSRGQEVRQGQTIGTMGSTGLSTGPHVHYEVWIGSEVIDPAKYLNISNMLSEGRIGD